MHAVIYEHTREQPYKRFTIRVVNGKAVFDPPSEAHLIPVVRVLDEEITPGDQAAGVEQHQIYTPDDGEKFLRALRYGMRSRYCSAQIIGDKEARTPPTA